MSSRTTLLKIKKLHIWVSGSRQEPYTHMYMGWSGRKNRVGTEIGYRGINVFLNISKATCSCSEDHKPSLKFSKYGFGLNYEGGIKRNPKDEYCDSERLFCFCTDFRINNNTPKWIQTLLGDYNSWKYWDDGFWGYDMDEYDTFNSDWVPPKRPLFIKFIWQSYKRRRKIKLCNHPNMEVDSDISGDSGSETHTCPDCGFYGHHIYY